MGRKYIADASRISVCLEYYFDYNVFPSRVALVISSFS